MDTPTIEEEWIDIAAAAKRQHCATDTIRQHVRKIRATAQPLTDEQKAALEKVFLEHLLEREAKRKTPEAVGTTP
ncbi:MAG: hypothetical protein ACTIOA_07910 [Brachybacterium tyrofermentans]|uniref:hypothetical protein n=1 Tax=Brachybacterium tyrofermentans TaxID=47848 RepID=UPI000A1AED2C|nr:hypothetical protein FM103_16590 [Corynebacterium xerosis]